MTAVYPITGTIKTNTLLTSINPATGCVNGHVDADDEDNIVRKVQHAKSAFTYWSKLSLKERACFLQKVYDTIARDKDYQTYIAHTITIDNGKPLVESYLEIASVLQNMKYLIRRGPKLLKDKSIFYGLEYITRKGTDHYKPFGVSAIIQPWNYPFYLPMIAITKALLAGNTVVFKPSEETPLIGKLIQGIFGQNGFPEGVINVAHGDGTVGEILLNQDVDHVVFTGSVEVGKEIGKKCEERNIPRVLELGGKDPAIIFNDANLNNALAGILWGALTNCGQACASVERVYVQEGVADDFIHGIEPMIKSLHIGNGMDDTTDIGPVINEMQLRKLETQIKDAREKGAHVVVGGKRIEQEGFFFEPTLMTDVDHSMSVMNDETFGPIIPIMTFRTKKDAVKLANSTRYGLAASIFTRDNSMANRVAEELHCGTVWINDPLFMQAHPMADWRGENDSGYGSSSLSSFVKKQHISTDRLPLPLLHQWQFPYAGKAKWLYKLIRLLF